MKNNELLDALEAYVMDWKESMSYPNDAKLLRLKNSEKRFRLVLLRQATPEEIREMFSDLRDYWDTLGTGH